MILLEPDEIAVALNLRRADINFENANKITKAQLKKVANWMKENGIDYWQIILKEVED